MTKKSRHQLFYLCILITSLITLYACINDAIAESKTGFSTDGNSHILKLNVEKYQIAAIKEALNKNWSKSKDIAQKSCRPELTKKFVEIVRILTAPNHYSLYEIHRFITDNAWVADIIEQHVENNITQDIKPEEIIFWFDKHKARTKKSLLLLYDAYIRSGKRKITNTSVIDIMVKNWRTTVLPNKLEQYIQTHYIKIFSSYDIKTKIDNLLWNNKAHATIDLLEFLPAADKHNYKLKTNVAINPSTIATLVTKEPEILNQDEFLNYIYVSYLLTNKQEDAALNKLRLIKNKKHPKNWWKYRNILIRNLLRDKQYRNAYNVTIAHGLKSGSDFAEASWLAGFISLRFLHKPKIAIEHFKNLYNTAKYSHSKSQAAYWLGRAYKELQDINNMSHWFNVAAKYSGFYYGQLALFELNPDGRINTFQISSHTNKQKAAKSKVENIALFAKILYLAGYRGREYFDKLLGNLVTLNIDDLDAKMIITNYTKDKAYPLAVMLAKTLSNHGYLPIRDSYPRHIRFRLRECKSSKSFYLSIIRQESGFDQKALSVSGAAGLMQLMPDTAKIHAKTLGLHHKAYIFNAEANVAKGTLHIDNLMKYYNDNYILTIAAYNAGGSKVNRWMKEYGDPRTFYSLYKVLDWIELIPYAETRLYVKKVIENIVNYENSFSSTPIKSNLYLTHFVKF